MLTTPAGSIITMTERPISMNVTIQQDNQSHENGSNKWHYGSLNGQSTKAPIIPITYSNNATARDWKRCFVQSPSNLISEIKCQSYLAFDLNFAMTVDKAQGRTMDRIIIDLTLRPSGLKRQFEYPHIYVAFSRVRHPSHIRLLLHNGNTRHNLSYLEHLQTQEDIEAFYSGFHKTTGKWDDAIAHLKQKQI